MTPLQQARMAFEDGAWDAAEIHAQIAQAEALTRIADRLDAATIVMADGRAYLRTQTEVPR